MAVSADLKSTNRSKVVLGADDSPEDLALMNAMLTGAGYNFVSATSGEDCLALVYMYTPCLILLDIQMPGLGGIETCRRLREIPEAKTIPIAFVTVSKTREDLKLGLAAGGNDFIVKPIQSDAFLKRVQHWTNRRVGVTASA
jgi:CheY-like chemotaxis protein